MSAPSSASWRALMAIALLRFGLSPDGFWALSPVEWRAIVRLATNAPGAAPPLSRAEFEALLTNKETQDG